MPQNAFQVTGAKTAAGSQAQGSIDPFTTAILSEGGATATALHVTAATVIKAGRGRVKKIVILSAGTTSGSFTINDSATTGGAANTNAIWSVPFDGASNVQGNVIDLDCPVTNGIVVSTVPGGGAPVLSIFYV